MIADKSLPIASSDVVDKKYIPRSCVFFAVLMIVTALIPLMGYGILLAGWNQLVFVLDKYPLVKAGIFYLKLPQTILFPALALRLITTLVQLIWAIGFIRLKPWALTVGRLWLIAGTILTILNPFYPDSLVIVAACWYIASLAYCYHPRTHYMFTNGGLPCEQEIRVMGLREPELTTDEDPAPAGGAVAILAISMFEIIAGLFLMRAALWTMPLDGVVIDLERFLHLPFIIAAPRYASFIIAIGIILTGFAFVHAKKIGHTATLLLGAILTSFAILAWSVVVINQLSTEFNLAVTVLPILVVLLGSYGLFYLLTHPAITDQFVHHSRSPRRRIIHSTCSTLIIGLCVFLFYSFDQEAPWIEPFKRTTNHLCTYGRDHKVQAERTIRAVIRDTFKTHYDKQFIRLSKQFMRLYNEGNYGEAEKIGYKALYLAKRFYGPEHDNLTVSLNNLGLLYYTTEDFDKAEIFLKKALAINEKIHGAGHPKTATDLNNLAELYRAKGDLLEAGSLYLRAENIYETYYGKDYPLIAVIQQNIAGLYQDREHDQSTVSHVTEAYEKVSEELAKAQSKKQTAAAPVFEGPTNLMIAEGDILTFQITVKSLDDTVPSLRYELPPGATFTKNTFRWQPQYTQSGLHYARFIADNGSAKSQHVVTIKVKDQRPPAPGNCDDSAQHTGFIVSWDKIPYAAEYVLRYRAADTKDWKTITTPYSSYIITDCAPLITYEWQVALRDTNNTLSDFSLSRTITTTNLTPLVRGPQHYTIEPGSSINCVLQKFDGDGDPTTWITDIPQGASFSRGNFSWTPQASQIGTYEAHFQADDSYEKSQEHTIQITIKAPTRQ